MGQFESLSSRMNIVYMKTSKLKRHSSCVKIFDVCAAGPLGSYSSVSTLFAVELLGTRLHNWCGSARLILDRRGTQRDRSAGTHQSIHCLNSNYLAHACTTGVITTGSQRR